MATPFENPFHLMQQNLISDSLAFSVRAIDTLDRITNLQLQVLKVTFDETGTNLANVVRADGATAATDAVAAWIKPGGEKFQAWCKHLENIAIETGTDLALLMQKQIAGNGSSPVAVLEAATVESPAGSQGVFPWMQPALFDNPAQKRSARPHGENSPASRRPRTSGVNKVKRTANRKKASPINV